MKNVAFAVVFSMLVVTAALAPAKQSHADPMPSAEALFAMAETADRENRWDEAAALYQQAIEIEPNFDRLMAAHDLARRSYAFDEMARYADQLVALTEAGSDRELLSIALNERGLGMNAAGNYAEAEANYRRSLTTRAIATGVKDVDYAISLSNMAVSVKNQNRLREAESLYRQALEILEREVGVDALDYGYSLNNLAVLMDLMGDYAQAEALYRQAIEITRNTFGENSVQYGTRLNNLALAVWSQGREDEARVMLEEALAVRRATLPADHPYIASTLESLSYLAPDKY